VRQIVLLESDLLAILADDSHSTSIIKVFRQNQESNEFEEIHHTKGVGMIPRLFPQVSGGHLFFITSDCVIHDIGDPKASTPMSSTAISRFTSRCPWITFANVDNHVHPTSQA
jgi:hypothetical protein